MPFPPKQGKAPHHSGTYHVRAMRLRAQANATPGQRCWRCGYTIQEVRAGTPGRGPKPNAKWTAGHLIDGQVDGPMLPECSPCPASSGARLANRRARANTLRRRRTEHTW